MEGKMPYKYKVKQDTEGNALVPNGTTLPNIGVVRDGYIESSVKFENPNFELVGGEQAAHLAAVVPQADQSAQPKAESDGLQ